MPRSLRRAGCTVIDNSSLFRMDPDVPLVVPEVNPEAIAGYRAEEHHRQSQLLDRAAGGGAEAAARRGDDQARGGRDLSVGVGRGQDGMDELFEQARNIFVGDSNEPAIFPKQIAFNVIPHIDDLPRRRLDQGRMEDGGRDQEDPRSRDQGHRDLRAGAGVRRPFRSGQYRVRK